THSPSFLHFTTLRESDHVAVRGVCPGRASPRVLGLPCAGGTISLSARYECPYAESLCAAQTGPMNWPLRSRHHRSAPAAEPADGAMLRLMPDSAPVPLQPLQAVSVGGGIV